MDEYENKLTEESVDSKIISEMKKKFLNNVKDVIHTDNAEEMAEKKKLIIQEKQLMMLKIKKAQIQKDKEK